MVVAQEAVVVAREAAVEAMMGAEEVVVAQATTLEAREVDQMLLGEELGRPRLLLQGEEVVVDHPLQDLQQAVPRQTQPGMLR